MIWIGIFIGGLIGMLIMALLQMGKISDLYKEIDFWEKRAEYYLHIYMKLCDSFKSPFVKYYKAWHDEAINWENLKNEKATSEKPK